MWRSRNGRREKETKDRCYDKEHDSFMKSFFILRRYSSTLFPQSAGTDVATTASAARGRCGGSGPWRQRGKAGIRPVYLMEKKTSMFGCLNKRRRGAAGYRRVLEPSKHGALASLKKGGK